VGCRLVFINAFSDVPFAGNPAAVCFLADETTDGWLQAVAGELNQPATAFLTVMAGGEPRRLRWFSPTTELALCGHGTLAAAHALWEEGQAAAGEPLRFETRAGVLTCTRDDGWIAMDFPAEPPVAVETPPAELNRALGVDPQYVGRNRLDYLIELDSEAAVRAARPDLTALAAVPTRGVMLTAPAEAAEVDFVSRFFAPAVGAGEDAVTGSAHLCLGPFWGERLGKHELVGYQASARGGTVQVRLRGQRMELLGQAVTVAHGTWTAGADQT
jgi:PhzF family phenazine biosynthesis protein